MVCLGSALGGGARYLLSAAALRILGPSFPFGTLLVNLLGSFLIGLIVHAGLGGIGAPSTLRIFLTTGVMGGLTTYSTFNFETLELFRSGAFGLAFLNLAVTVVACLGAGILGLMVGRAVSGA
ncbi:CrcB protein [Vulgatibacter incomptus]|uniref:Fluoride-specific ion channel FluC n=1 Tax=Vulgatibacter incomptus TaxID=1391653 RepID=A0A0K1PIC2_9BACT|nr:CrcB protein [Vulgatibacter incomptus]